MCLCACVYEHNCCEAPKRTKVCLILFRYARMCECSCICFEWSFVYLLVSYGQEGEGEKALLLDLCMLWHDDPGSGEGLMQERPCSSCQTSPAAAKLPGTEGLFGECKYRRAFYFFCSIQVDLQRFPLISYASKMIHYWKMGIRLPPPPAFSFSPSGQHIVAFHSWRACRRLVSQRATQHLDVRAYLGVNGTRSIHWIIRFDRQE